jgi:hypothetical protein
MTRQRHCSSTVTRIGFKSPPPLLAAKDRGNLLQSPTLACRCENECHIQDTLRARSGTAGLPMLYRTSSPGSNTASFHNDIALHACQVTQCMLAPLVRLLSVFLCLPRSLRLPQCSATSVLHKSNCRSRQLLRERFVQKLVPAERDRDSQLRSRRCDWCSFWM